MSYQRRKPRVEEVHELKVPQSSEIIGVVLKAVGASNFRVRCVDNLERLCSIPGRLRRRFWIKEGDLVLVKPWVVQGNERADIVWRYSLSDKEKFRSMGVKIPQ
jgi:translation initiation factor 1A